MIAEATDEELLTVARATWRATPHPLLRWATDDELVAALRMPDGHALLDALFKEREERIALSLDDGDPLRYGFELENWKDADELLRENKLVYVAGGKRASKSEWAAKRVMQCALAHGKSVIWCFQDNVRTSISTQQKLLWKFLPPELKRFNGKEDRRKVFKISYTPANGFANSILVLPNRTEIHFLTYNQDVKEFQGWEIGANVSLEANVLSPESGKSVGSVPNIGAWADENLTLPWLETLDFRSTTRNAKILWTFSTTEGITTTIKEVLGAAETLKSRFAELLPERVNVPGLPVGHMPYVQRCQRKGTAAIYFFTEFNVFGDNYSGVKALCQGRPSHYIEENAYGYARDVMHKAFPLFGEWNVVDPKNIPAKGTNYMFTDPAGARNWATLWVRVTPGNPGKFYIYRDWPDAQSYGEWAVASDDPAQPDGKAGSAQRSLGLGVEQMKALWRSLESKVLSLESAPQDARRNTLDITAEVVFQRFIDPRAGRNPHANEHGGTCLVDQFADGENPMLLTPASGVDVERGLSVVNDLLWWDNTKPMDMLTNAPRLFVSRECKQVLWMMNNYTGRGGEKAGAKDFADLLRYMALAELEHYDDTTLRSLGGGSY